MKTLSRLAAIGTVAILAVALSGCVVRPLGGWGGHRQYDDRHHSDKGSDRRDRHWDDSRRRGR
jgi:hypothetical protein